MSDDRMHKMQQEFLEKHKDADELVCSTKTKHCIKAVYYSPMEKFVHDTAREFFRLVSELEDNDS